MTTKITKLTDFQESMTRELTNFIRSEAAALSLADLDRLIINLPVLRERLAKLPLQTYPYLADQLEFLGRFVEEQVVRRNPRSGRRTSGRRFVCAAIFSAHDGFDSRLHPQYGSVGRRDHRRHGAAST